MIIADLNYLEIATVNVEGGSHRRSSNVAYADAFADALAFGYKTDAQSFTSTGTVTTYYSSAAGSTSASYSKTY